MPVDDITASTANASPASQQARSAVGKTVRFLAARAAEPSSWRGVIFIFSSLGIVLRPEVSSAIIAAGMGIAGLISVLTADPAPPEPGE